MHPGEMAQLTLDDQLRHPLHRRGDVGEKPGLLAGVEGIEQRPQLRVIVVALGWHLLQ